MTNPYQQEHNPDLTLGEALRAIAERVSFRTEEEGKAVHDAIDRHIAAETDSDKPTEADDEDQGDEGDKTPTPEAPPAPVKATKAARR